MSKILRGFLHSLPYCRWKRAQLNNDNFFGIAYVACPTFQ
jgi:hypothetical protein